MSMMPHSESTVCVWSLYLKYCTDHSTSADVTKEPSGGPSKVFLLTS